MLEEVGGEDDVDRAAGDAVEAIRAGRVECHVRIEIIGAFRIQICGVLDLGPNRIDEFAIAAGKIQDNGVSTEMFLKEVTTDDLPDKAFPRQVLVLKSVPIKGVEHEVYRQENSS